MFTTNEKIEMQLEFVTSTGVVLTKTVEVTYDANFTDMMIKARLEFDRDGYDIVLTRLAQVNKIGPKGATGATGKAGKDANAFVVYVIAMLSLCTAFATLVHILQGG